jgi:prenyltransferase beta subunit
MFNKIFKFFFIIVFVSMLLFSNAAAVNSKSLKTDLHQKQPEDTIQLAVAYLKTQLNKDGGIRWIDENSNVAATIRVVWALAANHTPQHVLTSSSGNSPIDYLEAHGKYWVFQNETENPSFNTARGGQLLTAIAAANKNPHSFGVEPVDYIDEINMRYDSNLGVYGTSTKENVTDQVWSIIGLGANNAPIPANAVDWLLSAQLEDGSWNDGFGSFLDMTPLAIMAIIASDHVNATASEIQNAVDFLKQNQQIAGGWQTQWDSTTNANTTGMILQAISAVGQSGADEAWQKSQGNPLVSLQNIQDETGAIGGEYANAYSTADAILGLSGQPIFRLGQLERVSSAFDFIIQNQEEDGGWGSVGQTIDVILAAHAAGWDPDTFTKSASPLDYIAENLNSYVESGPDAIGKLILGLVASGENPLNFAEKNLLDALMADYNKNTFAFGDEENSWHQSFAILGLASVGEAIPEGARDTLKGLQEEDGGWAYASGTGTWPDSTALAIQALLAAGVSKTDSVLQKGLEYIAVMQQGDGGWGDSSTTAFVIMALNALGDLSENWVTDSRKTPLTNLLSFQKTNGTFVYSWDFPDDNLMATTAAIFALLDGNYHLNRYEFNQSNYAALIIDPGDQKDIIKRCLEIDQDGVTGMDFLESSQLGIETDQGFVNAIGGIKNPNGGTMYWSSWHWDGRAWQFYETGAAQTTVLPGSIQAWYLTSWEEFPSRPPKYSVNLYEICGSDVLKNFKAQPYLSYEDVTFRSIEEIPPTEIADSEVEQLAETQSIDEPTIQPTQTVITQTTPDQISRENQTGVENKIIPLVIISIFGLFGLIFTVILLKQKKS